MGWKSILRGLDPGARLILGSGNGAKNGDAALQGYAEHQTNSRALDTEMDNYGKIPQMLMDKYTQSAKTAGTYGATPEFQAGLSSEVQAGTRGARVESASRINALRKALGNQDEFKPEDAGNTGGNVTQDALRNVPSPSSTFTPSTSSSSQAGPAAAPDMESPSADDAASKATSFSGVNRSKRLNGMSGRIGSLKRFGK